MGNLNKKDSNIFPWIIIIAVSTILFFSHIYGDILITARQGMNLWNNIIDGNISEFYISAKMKSGNYIFNSEQYASYPFGFYLIFAIWEFPVWLLQRITGANVYNTVCAMLWSKLLLVLFLTASIIMIKKIINLFDEYKEHSNLVCILFASSSVIFSGIFVASQYDIVTIFFVLTGYYYWNKNNNKLFILFFIIAASLKYFALLYFTPLALISQKNIFKLIRDAVLVIVPNFIISMFFEKPEGQSSLVSELIGKFFNISPFLAVVFFACLWSYIEKVSTENEKFILSVKVLFLIFSAFCIFADIHPYWAVLAVPVFSLICCVTDKKNTALVIASETIMSAAIVLRFILSYRHVFDANTVIALGIIPRILGVPEGEFSNYSLAIFLENFFNSAPVVLCKLLYYVSVVFGVGTFGLHMGIFNRFIPDVKFLQNKKFAVYFRLIVNTILGLTPMVVSVIILIVIY